jgi:hypothetical protein
VREHAGLQDSRVLAGRPPAICGEWPEAASQVVCDGTSEIGVRPAYRSSCDTCMERCHSRAQALGSISPWYFTRGTSAALPVVGFQDPEDLERVVAGSKTAL